MITNINQLDVTKQYTYADYLTWKFTEMVELIKGKLFILSPAPSSYHQRILSNLHGEIYAIFKTHKCDLFIAPFDVRLVKNKALDTEIITVVQPDFCIICDPTKVDAKGCVGAPDFIIEIISPGSIKKDYNEKYNLYQENEVREYWIVNPDAKSIHQYYLNEEKIFIEKEIHIQKGNIIPHIFPDMQVALETIF